MKRNFYLIIAAILLIILLTSSTITFEDKLIKELSKRKNTYKVSRAEASKLKRVAIKNGIKPEYLSNLIIFETAGTFSPAAHCKGCSTDASGLIQFTASTARSLGTTTEQIRKMSFIKQLDYVDKYLSDKILEARLRGIKQFDQIDTFMLVFYPIAVGNHNYRFPNNVIAQNNGISTPVDYANRALKNRLF